MIIRKGLVLAWIWILLHSLAFSLPTKEEDNKIPSGCLPKGHQFFLKTLKLIPSRLDAEQSLYVLFNQGNQAITLYQMSDDDNSRSMYLNHSIEPHYWAVLSSHEKELKFICAVAKNKSSYGKIVDCGSVLKVCEYTNARFGLNTRGNYWLVNNSSRNAAVMAIVHYGIIPASTM